MFHNPHTQNRLLSFSNLQRIFVVAGPRNLACLRLTWPKFPVLSLCVAVEDHGEESEVLNLLGHNRPLEDVKERSPCCCSEGSQENIFSQCTGVEVVWGVGVRFISQKQLEVLDKPPVEKRSTDQTDMRHI